LVLKHIDDSKVCDLFANHIGNDLTADEIRQAFDESFGSGTGDRVAIKCSHGNIQELKINLAGTIETSINILDFISDAWVTWKQIALVKMATLDKLLLNE